MADEFPVKDAALKKLVKRARRQPINFGFNPGTDDSDRFLAAHKKKPAAMMAKVARNEGAGNKAAFGSFTVEGNILSMKCEREVPKLAKLFKKYLRINKINLNVQVLDAAGNVLDSDIEDLPEEDWMNEPDDADDDDDDGDSPAGGDDDAPEAAAPAAPEAPPAAPPPPSPEAVALVQRIKALQPKVAEAPPAVAGKLGEALKAAVGQIRGGDVDAATRTVGQVEAVLARLGPAPAAPAPEAAPAAPPPPPADPRLARLREAVEKVRAQVEALPEAAEAPLSADLRTISAQLEAGEAEATLGGLRGVQEGLKAALAAQARWNKAFGVIEPQVNKALTSQTVADPSGLRVKWQYAVGLGADGAFEKAIAALTPVAAILRAAPAADGDAPEAPAEGGDTATRSDTGVVAFQKSRLMWIGARNKMLAEARSLAEAIVGQGSEDDDAAEIAAAAKEIMADVEAIDERLQDALDDITNAEPGRARDAARQRAAGIVKEYQGLLSQGLFAMIDANPFKPVAVASGARAALAAISRTLA